MQKLTNITASIVLVLSMGLAANGQTALSTDTGLARTSTLIAAPGKGFTKAVIALDGKYSSIAGQVDRQTAIYLGKLENRELALRKKLQGLDSNRAKQLLGSTEAFYKGIQEKMRSPEKKLQSLKQYVPGLDSIGSATKFLGQLKGANLSTDQLGKVAALNGSVAALQSKLQAATSIKQLLQAREQEIKAQLSKYDVGKQLAGMNKQVYYYQQQLGEYKVMLHDTKKLEDRAMSIVRGMPAFKSFFAKNSFLAQLFPRPQNTAAPGQALAGLQIRAAVTQQLTAAMGNATGTAAGNPQQYLQQQVQAAQGQMDKLKEKLNKLGGGSTDMAMPDFKPNGQKTKSFLKRLEYGINIQSQKPNGWLPVTSDLAATLGYKLNDNATVGAGLSYKLGWGNGLRDIHLTGQGIGLRGYLNIKAKKTWWVTGGYEKNHMSGFEGLPNWGDRSLWQESGLVGLTKKYKIGKKTSNMQLLWDFLSYGQVPIATPIKFRVGYTF